MNSIRRHGEWVISFLFSLSFLVFFSFSTTPLFDAASLDSEIFQDMGIAVLKGKTPYVDLFDHKGCILYFINALGIWINRTWGLLLLQILFFCVNVYLWLKIVRILTPMASNIYFLMSILFVLLSYFDGGNLTEEWSLLFISLPIYWCVQSLSKDRLLNVWQLFVIGLCIGIVTFIRVNNILLIFGYLAYFLWLALKNKQYSYVGKGIFFICMGILIPMLICTYFFYIKAGVWGCEELWFGTFGFNMEYMSRYNSTTPLSFWFKILSYAPIVMMILLSLLCMKKDWQQVIPLLLSFGVGLLLVGQTLFRHYFLVFVPLMAVTWGLLAGVTCSRVLRLVFLLTFIGASFNPLRRYVEHFAIGNNQKVHERREQFTKMIAQIPIVQRDSIWSYNAQEAMDAFVTAGIVQCNRIIIPFHLDISAKLAESEKNKIVEVHPQWVLLNRKYAIHDAIDREYIGSNYVPVDSTYVEGIENVVLMHRK